MAKKQEKKSNVIVEKVQKASDAVTGKIKDYNEKYVAKNIEKGREALKEYNEKYVVKNIEKGKEYIEKPYKKITGKVDEVLAKGRDLEKDAFKKLDGVIVNGKKFMYKLPLVETVEKKVTNSLNSLPGYINMPNKGEIQKLTQAMQSLNKNIEALKNQKMV
ncbi:MAG: hypothetical protein WA081_08760 [Desulfosalsimonadaceae bacterium]